MNTFSSTLIRLCRIMACREMCTATPVSTGRVHWQPGHRLCSCGCVANLPQMPWGWLALLRKLWQEWMFFMEMKIKLHFGKQWLWHICRGKTREPLPPDSCAYPRAPGCAGTSSGEGPPALPGRHSLPNCTTSLSPQSQGEPLLL